MKRAMFVTAGTAVGLVSVLSYPGGAQSDALAGVPTSLTSGLGAPSAESADPPAAPTVPGAASAAPATSKTARTSKPTRTSKPARPVATPIPTPAPTSTPKPVTEPTAPPKKTAGPGPTPTPTPKKSAPAKKPAATPTPVASVAKDFTGSAVAYKYGTVQVAIRVKDGRVLDAWAVSYPKGESLPYSEMAIPILRSRTVAAQSDQIATVSGASFTSAAWTKSLAAALAEAGL